MIAAEHQGPHQIWPADRFYWAILDASILPPSLLRRRVDERRLGYLFESALPLPADEVHAVYVPLGGDRYLACAIEHERLRADLPRDAVTLSPGALPEAIAETRHIDPGSINLLTGPHEPNLVRRERRRCLVLASTLGALLTIVIMWGLEQRISREEALAEAARQHARAIHERLYDPATTSPSVQPAPLRLLAELRQLRRTRSSATSAVGLEEPDSARTLASFLENWPTDHLMQTESLSVTPSSVTVIGLLPSATQAQAFVEAFDPPTQWQASQAQVSAVSGGVRLTWRFSRRAGAERIATASSSQGDRP